MKVYSVSIFAEGSAVPKFGQLFEGNHVTLHISSDISSPEVAIFFNSIQEATNFKNDIIQSWETFLRKAKEEKL